MQLSINGTKQAITDASTVGELLARQGIDPAHVVVELNRNIVPREDYDTQRIKPDDTLEILRFVGGG